MGTIFKTMGTIFKTKEGTWRAQVRRKGKYASQTFKLKTLADEWIVETERLIDIGLVERSTECERRPTEDEVSDIIAHFENTPSIIPMARIVRFAIATAMRQE